MTEKAIDRLVAHASSALGPALSGAPHEVPTAVLAALRPLLGRVNGFYAFESCLHVFPVGDGASGEVTLEDWNRTGQDGWRFGYGDSIVDLWFFAEDVFGHQFAWTSAGVCAFDPETGESTILASSLDGWAESILADRDFLTGYSLGHEWQQLHGALKPGHRLVPKIPFVIGGLFEVENLHEGRSLDAMRWRADLAIQIREMPDGEAVRLVIGESEQ